MAEFSEKVVLVTGASSGIGQATAEAFAKHGAYLAITGRNEENLAKVASNCRKNGAKDVLQITAEFTDQHEVEKIVEKTVKKFKKIDVLVNNAGHGKYGTLQNATMEDFDQLFNVNVKAVVVLTQLAMPHLIETKGNVVNVSSVFSQIQFPTMLLYGMTKAALDQFTKTVALEYAPHGVRVNAVNPGVVRTNMMRFLALDAKGMDDFYANVTSCHPLGRIGKAEEIAGTILFLASKESAWTTGQCLSVDGGMTLTMQQPTK